MNLSSRQRGAILALMLAITLAAAAQMGDDAPADAEHAVVEPRRQPATSLPKTTAHFDFDANVARIDLTTVKDIFKNKSRNATSQSDQAQKVPTPTAPPMPFNYFGRLEEADGRIVVYLAHGEHAYAAREGDVIDGVWRLESIAPGRLTLTYLPLDIKQALSIGNTP